MNFKEATAGQLAREYREGTTTVSEVISGVLEEIERRDPELKSFLRIRKDEAMEEARAADRAFAENEPVGPLAGIPLAVKDNLHIRGERTTCGSRILEGLRPPVQLDRRRPVAKGRGHRHWQDQHGRVCNGIVH